MHETYKGEGISLTRSARPVFLFISLFVLSGLFMYSHGWTTITQWIVSLTIVVLIFCIWFPYSPFVKIELYIVDDQVHIGKYIYTIEQIDKIVNNKEGLTYDIHLINKTEPISIRMDEGFQKNSSDYIQQWANYHEIDYEKK